MIQIRPVPILLFAGGLALAGLTMACSSGTASPTTGPPPVPIIIVVPDNPTRPSDFPLILTPPDLDLYALAGSLIVKNGEPLPRTSLSGPSDRAIGDRHTFWVIDLDALEPFQVTASLRHISLHLYMYVADGASIKDRDLARAAEEFEATIYPEVVSRFGRLFATDEGEDIPITVLHVNIPAVVGYYNPGDLLPRVIRPFSNELPMIYMNAGAVKPGTREYSATLAHELQHVAHDASDSTEEVWINEGLSALAEEIINPSPPWPNLFISAPDTQLTGWATELDASGPHYGAAHLFATYLVEHYGGADPRTSMRVLASREEDGIEGIDAYLKVQGYDIGFDGVFKEWVVANFLDERVDSEYGYTSKAIRIPATRQISDYGRFKDSVSQYAADYVQISLRGKGARIVFQGFPFAKLLPNEAHSGRWQWWSNRGDSIDSTLTREFDLSRVQGATLNFWAWYDIEEDFDHAYVQVSIDGGTTWDILQGRHSSLINPLGYSFGPSFTGISGSGDAPHWVPESIDLSDYTGGKVLLRFQYLTDDAVNATGLAVDDISIPEIGFSDDVEEDGGWEARGFYRTDNALPQRFFVQVIQLGEETRVLDVPLTFLQQGEIIVPRFGDAVKQVVLVIAGATPVTTEPATYELSIEPLPGE
ncbi:MAG: hypothetical protein V3U79_03275 [Dehalococcoidia bacterium]